MTPGPDIFYKCPSCGAVMKNGSIMSGNIFGAMFFSDGRRFAPMLPDIPDLTKCPICDTILWLSEMEALGEKKVSDRTDYSDHPDWKEVPDVEHLKLDDLWRALDYCKKFRKGQKEREIFIRQRIWWEYNRIFKMNADETSAWRGNCLDLLALLDLNNDNQRCMAAELRRNLGDFSKCLDLIRTLPDNYKPFRLRIMKACAAMEQRTFEINHDQKVDEEDFYDILQNGENELLFCIGEYDGEPENPELVYNGGELAVLCRNPNHAVILDKVHPGVHEQLKITKNVLFAECVRSGEENFGEKLESGLVRNYMVEVIRNER
jgi:hypothetical protein